MALETVQLNSGQVLKMHKKEDCTPPCAVHSPSDHHMKEWKLIWRDDRNIFERVCPHGIGHPDPDTLEYLAKMQSKEDAAAEASHGCDGCCRSKLETAWAPHTV